MARTKRIPLALVSAALLVGRDLGGGARAASRPTVAEFMAKVGFGPTEIATATKGEIVSRVLETRMVGPNNSAEVAVLGVVRVDVPRQTFIDAVEQQPTTFRNTEHLKTGIIQNPPQASDFAALAFPPEDIKDLKECRPGKCALKLGGPTLADLQSKIDWKSKDAADQVNRLARERLLAIMAGYMKEGIAAFKPLEDKSTTVSIDEQFRQLLESTPMLISLYPELVTYLKDYPHATLPSSKGGFYWALDDFGLKPTLAITQVVGYVPPGTDDVLVAWKQLYASHYFNGGLSITTYVKEGEASYVVEVDRVRADSLGGAFGGVKRSKMAGAMEGSLRKFLEVTKAKLQAATGPSSPRR
jgi:sulfur carrier protein ThiS